MGFTVSEKDGSKLELEDEVYYKFVSNDLSRNGFFYQKGLVHLNEKFVDTTQCGSGGLYYAKKEHLHFFMGSYGHILLTIRKPKIAK
jgi:hypothetical protein